MIRAVVVATLLLPGLALAQSVPMQVSYQGRLMKDGLPATGTVKLGFALFSAETGGTAKWTETYDLALTDGFYALLLGDTTAGKKALSENDLAGPDLFLEITVNQTTVLSPRTRIGSVPFAVRARTADTASGLASGVAISAGTVTATSVVVGGKTVIDSSGTIAGALTTSSVAAGSGLSATSGALSLALQATAPLSGAGTQASPLALSAASATVDGYLSRTDWASFNAKVSSITAGQGITVSGTAQNPTISLSASGGGGRPARFVSGFAGEPGPDLTFEGFTQCYGWRNDGKVPAPPYATIRTACGQGTTVLFAGNRAGSPTLIRHQAELNQPFINFLPATLPASAIYYDVFDADRRYTFAVDANWLMLGVNGNRWTDPGRLWEPNIVGGAAATDGHVLSQEGNQANDQNTVTGDRYFVYLRGVAPTNMSCKTIYDADNTKPSGVYTIYPDGTTPLQVYCDMSATAAGGAGWTLVMQQVPGSLLPDSQADVNAANFGTLDKTYRVGMPLMKNIAPVTAWKLTDGVDTIYFKPSCRVDWTRNYYQANASNDCNLAYASTAFNASINNGYIDVATRGIGVNNNAAYCSMRAYNSVSYTPAGGTNVPAGPATNCNFKTDTKVQLWYR